MNIRKKTPNKIALYKADEIFFINLEEILAFEADGNYTKVHLKGKDMLVNNTLKAIEEQLDAFAFFRASRSFLVNLTKVASFQKPKCILILENGIEIVLSRKKKDDFMDKISGLL